MANVIITESKNNGLTTKIEVDSYNDIYLIVEALRRINLNNKSVSRTSESYHKERISAMRYLHKVAKEKDISHSELSIISKRIFNVDSMSKLSKRDIEVMTRVVKYMSIEFQN